MIRISIDLWRVGIDEKCSVLISKLYAMTCDNKIVWTPNEDHSSYSFITEIITEDTKEKYLIEIILQILHLNLSSPYTSATLYLSTRKYDRRNRTYDHMPVTTVSIEEPNKNGYDGGYYLRKLCSCVEGNERRKTLNTISSICDKLDDFKNK